MWHSACSIRRSEVTPTGQRSELNFPEFLSWEQRWQYSDIILLLQFLFYILTLLPYHKDFILVIMWLFSSYWRYSLAIFLLIDLFYFLILGWYSIVISRLVNRDHVAAVCAVLSLVLFALWTRRKDRQDVEKLHWPFATMSSNLVEVGSEEWSHFFHQCSHGICWFKLS